MAAASVRRFGGGVNLLFQRAHVLQIRERSGQAFAFQSSAGGLRFLQDALDAADLEEIPLTEEQPQNAAQNVSQLPGLVLSSATCSSSSRVLPQTVTAHQRIQQVPAEF
jgi:hypothetical protein